MIEVCGVEQSMKSTINYKSTEDNCKVLFKMLKSNVELERKCCFPGEQ